MQVMPDFSDSDSDFESLPRKVQKLEAETLTSVKEKPEVCIDLVNDENSVIKELKDVTARIELIEEGLNRSLDIFEDLERVRRISSCLEDKNRSLERSLEEVKTFLSCIICKSVAQFPWLITSCCAVLMCKICAERWIVLDSTCPHCRAVISIDDSLLVNEIKSVSELVSKLVSSEDD